MSIRITCPHCRTRFQVGNEWAGQKGQCNTCGGLIEVAPLEELLAAHLKPIPSPDAAGPQAPTGSRAPTARHAAPQTAQSGSKPASKPNHQPPTQPAAASSSVTPSAPPPTRPPTPQSTSQPSKQPAPQAGAAPPPTAGGKPSGANASGGKPSSSRPASGQPAAVPPKAAQPTAAQPKVSPPAANNARPAPPASPVAPSAPVAPESPEPPTSHTLPKPSRSPWVAALEPVDAIVAEDTIDAVLVAPATSHSTAGVHSARPLTPEEILRAMQGEIKPVTTTTGYGIGVALATLVMLVLPLLYIGLIGLIILVVGWHATNNYTIIGAGRNGRAMVASFLLYAAPLLLGVVTIVFLIKPLFARPARDTRKRSLTRESEPLLFAFVERICAAVRAPLPRRIDVDCEVNASASFRRGFWSIFAANDLVLTIGMPFVAGISMHQFAGVLAHELGHFSQGAGLRLSYFVRVISNWFSRSVYERDSWDEWLANASQSIDIRIGWIFYLTRLCVWLTRRVLWLFMLAAHAVTGFLLQQMEYDADRYEARFSGSDTFELTCRRLAQLNISYQAALSDVQVWYREGRLGDDLPMLVIARADEMPAELREMLDKAIDESSSSWFESHPADSDRIRAAAREAAPGIFRVTRPAAELFAGYDILCRLVTQDMYEAILDDEFDPKEMHPSADLLVRRQRQKADEECLERLTLNCFHILRPIPLPAALPGGVAQPSQLIEDIKSARARLLESRAAYRQVFHAFDDADTMVFEGTAAVAMYRAGVPIPYEAFRFSVPPREHVDYSVAQARHAMKARSNEMLQFEYLVAARLERALVLLQHPKIAERLPDAPRWLQDAHKFLPIIYRVNLANDQLQEVRNCRAAMGRLCELLENHRDNRALIEGILAGNGWLMQQVNEYRRMLENVEYPFDHAKGSVPLSEHLAPPLVDPQDVVATYEATGQLLDRVISLYVRILGRLASYAEQVEKVLGLPPLEYPKDNGIEDRGT